MIPPSSRLHWLLVGAVAFLGTHAIAQTTIGVDGGRVQGLVPIAISGFTGEVDQALRFDLEVAGFSLVQPSQAQWELAGKNNGQVEAVLADAGKTAGFARAYPGRTTCTTSSASACACARGVPPG